MELLAPAGDMKALYSALNSGADALYLGYTAFGARAGAGNFTNEQLAQALHLCHSWGGAVYVTVNTLVKQKEMDELAQVVGLLWQLKADGIIVQDMGVANYVRRHFPLLPLHASTQMAIHNVQGARFLQDAGFSRVVLARECSLKTIEEVAALGIETEVFVHGALCVSQSGQCLFSGMVGGRSGNRGRCAQACRLPYQYDGRWGNWLSPRDINVRDDLDQLALAGVSSLKIEGRVKRAEYVSEVTAFYRKALADLSQNCFAPATDSENENIAQMFNRGGFTKGYAFGKQDGGIIDPNRVNHQGVPLGRVTRLEENFAFVLVDKTLYPEDGLRFLNKRTNQRGYNENEIPFNEGETPFNESETTYYGPLTEKGYQAKVRIRPDMDVRPGDEVMRLWNTHQLTQSLLRQRTRISVRATLWAIPGEESRLVIQDGQVEGWARGEVVEKAEKSPLTEESLEKNLAKLKETPFEIAGVTLVGEGAFMPAAKLNQLRNQAADHLIKARVEAFEGREKTNQKNKETGALQKGQRKSFTKPGILVKTRNAALGEAFRALGADEVLFAPGDFRSPQLEGQLAILPEGSWLCLPTQLDGQSLHQVADTVENFTQTIKGVALGSIGQLGQAFPVEIALLDSVPIWNKEACESLLAYGSRWEVAWPELNEKEIQAIEGADRPFVQMVYGRNRLMTLNHCPARTRLSLTSGRDECNMCITGRKESLVQKKLIDRKGYAFPLQPIHQKQGCVVEVLNSLPLNLFDQMNEKFPQRSILLDFTIETPEEQLAILEAFVQKRRGEPAQNPVGQSTQGHFARGVL